MTFIEQFETDLAHQIDSGSADTASIVVWASEKVLESYRNGIIAGREGTTVKRSGNSRRKTRFSQENRFELSNRGKIVGADVQNPLAIRGQLEFLGRA